MTLIFILQSDHAITHLVLKPPLLSQDIPAGFWSCEGVLRTACSTFLWVATAELLNRRRKILYFPRGNTYRPVIVHVAKFVG